MNRQLLRVFSLLPAVMILISGIGRAAESDRPFLHPERIRYDSHCLKIDGKDVFLYSGAFHYFRCPQQLWRDRFQKIRQAGFNGVETYVAWNCHETEMPGGLDDFSKANFKELDEWLTMAEEFGFYIIIRPGPYICAEWDSGGFPQWLLTKRPKQPLRSEGWLRSDDPVFLDWCKHYYKEVCPVIAPHQITKKAPGRPGVILFQLENEYEYASFSDEVKRNQVRVLAQAARANGIDIPLFTCWTHPVRGQSDPLLHQVFDSCNFYPRWGVDDIRKDIQKLGREQPDAPLMTTELQGGWFSQVGGKLSEEQEGVDAAQINNLTLFAIQNGETILNYYMLFGGTNPGDRAARNVTTTYDYNAPIREWGGVGERYQRVRAIAGMLREHGTKLARAEVIDCDVTVPQSDVTVVLRRALDGGRYFFIRTSQHSQAREGTAHIKEKSGQGPELSFDYRLEPFGSKVLYLASGVDEPAKGEWLPKTAPAIERPSDLPSAVTIGEAWRRPESAPSHWRKIRPEAALADVGVYDSGFVYYRAKIPAGAPTNLVVNYQADDAVLASVDGANLAAAKSKPGYSVFWLPPKAREVQLLYENRGHANGGEPIEAASGITSARLSVAPGIAGEPIAGWRMQEVPGTDNRPEVSPGFADADWKTVDVEKVDAANLPSHHIAVYRAHLNQSAEQLKQGKLQLNVGRIDDLGWVYINGQKVGETAAWDRAFSFAASPLLHAGDNVIAIMVKNNEGDGGLGSPTLSSESESVPLRLEAIAQPTGVQQNWYEQPRTKRWEKVALGASTASVSNAAALTWYRMEFKLPAARQGVWVPWRLLLNAAGNGFLYLNGHPLGRYWQVGPQHDFFLPECWLHFGDSVANNLTLSLRSVDECSSLQSAVVEPYAEFAEKR